MLGTAIGWIIMLKNLDDPAAIGPGLAISLLTVLYGMMLAFMVCLPLQTHISRDLPGAADGSIAGTAVMATLLTVFVSLATAGVLAGTLG